MTRSHPWRKSLDAARANLLPGMILQFFALLLVLAYYLHPPTRQALDVLAGWKMRLGWTFSLVSTAFFGGLIPFLYLRLHPATRPSTPGSHIFFYLGFWAYKGLEVDFFYRLQGLVFGEGPDWRIIIPKVATDQFVYVPLWSLPWALTLFRWKDEGFSVAAMRALRWREFLRISMPSAVLSTWGVWGPTVAIIYCLPSALQVPLFNIVLCFWVLLFTTLTRRESSGASEAT